MMPEQIKAMAIIVMVIMKKIKIKEIGLTGKKTNLKILSTKIDLQLNQSASINFSIFDDREPLIKIKESSIGFSLSQEVAFSESSK